jgi:hypothetical protein
VFKRLVNAFFLLISFLIAFFLFCVFAASRLCVESVAVFLAYPLTGALTGLLTPAEFTQPVATKHLRPMFL